MNNQCTAPCTSTSCPVGQICDPSTQLCTPSFKCGDGQITPPEKCEFDALGNSFGNCLPTEFCDAATCTCGSIQQYCPTQTLCSGNYVCDLTNTCSPCDATNPCPNGYSCLADGTCRLPPAGQCGNAQLEPGEECEYIIGSAGISVVPPSGCPTSGGLQF